mmetsp:Transcript_93858/g.254735  ORF Transcript_93858/g.254735 Transcript_93858/m.254735 type:complete len:206 (-) Transcript_93858:113-730(-)
MPAPLDVRRHETSALLVAFPVVFTLSRTAWSEAMHEFWTVLLPFVAYSLGIALARKRRNDIRSELVSRVCESSSPETTLKLYDSMVEQGIVLDPTAVDRVLCACAALGEIDRALRIHDEMPLGGIVPSSEAYGALIRSCAAAGRAEEALSLFDSMREACVVPDGPTCRAAIRCYASAERPGEAAALLLEVLAREVRPGHPGPPPC